MDMTPDEPRNEERRRWGKAKKVALASLCLLPVALIATGYTFVVDVVDPWWTPYVMVGFDMVLLTILSGAAYWEYSHAVFEYTTEGGIAWEFIGKEYYSRPERMRRIERAVEYSLLESDLDVDIDKVHEWLSQIGITIVDSDLPKVRGQDPAGMTMQRLRHSYVEGDYSRSLGTTGWEILLQLFPNFAPNDGMTEAAKEAWMVSNGILPLRYPPDVPSANSSLTKYEYND